MCHLFSCFCLSTPTKICKFVANYNVKAMSVCHLKTLVETGKMSDIQTKLNII